MRQRRILWATLACCVLTSASHAAVVIPQTLVARYGLTRAWFTQVGSPAATGPIRNVTLDRGTLFVQTQDGMVTALDAETGRILWSTQVGPRNHTCSEPAANHKFVTVVNGSVLFVLDRTSGQLQWQKQLSGSPGAGPALSRTHVFIPMIDGRMEAYEVEKGSKQKPWNYKSFGRVLVRPMITGQTVSWTTEKGYFYVADPEGLGIRYRLETRDAIHSRPGYWTPNLYACSSDGYVYAVDEATGRINWKFAIGDAIFRSPVAIDSNVFVISELGGMYCLDGKAASQLWVAPKMTQFLAASPTRVYACDQLNRLAVLDAKTGNRLGTMPLDETSMKLVNDQSDRIFLASEAGVMQCLREVELKSPIVHTPPPTRPLAAVKTKSKSKAPVEDAKEKPAKGAKAKSADDEPAAEEADQPAMEEEKPAAEGEADDPFK
ncbi:MAG: PQQ-binding-like beta-propeller repeat protein [Planctomycetia bacterium]|nr:PQQ-binding-like beta-propeller repeat protein [Planctomycetia bacterium]